MMDRLHDVLRAIRPETKAAKDHLSVFREFLAHLDQLQRQPPGANAPMRRKAVRQKA
ncbi:hypothetical protein [Tardiphaga alba]|uniref:hypothetical protein n=1 Tax=Tardiphaga alba TaxID=340268 RepID=UPI001BA7AF9D|nr:hypothetical protein [Tardiphaga alba]